MRGCEKIAGSAAIEREVAAGAIRDELVAIATGEERSAADAASQPIAVLLAIFSQPLRNMPGNLGMLCIYAGMAPTC